MKGRLWRYAPMQMLDYMIERGAVTLGMGLLFGWVVLMNRGAGPDDWAQGEQGLRIIRGIFASLLGVFTWFGTLTAVNGMISNDRVKGTFRFLFSKPIGVLWYYAQAWVIHGLGLLLVISLLMAIFSVTVRPFFPPGILLYVTMIYVVLGGAGFLLSSITKRDGIYLVVFWLIALVLRLEFQNREGFQANVVRFVTPPSAEMSFMIDAILRDAPINMDTFWAAAGYGAVCFLAGLVVLRYRPMTS